MRILGMLVLAVVLAGCGPAAPVRVTARGTVKYNGKPVESGIVTFWSADDPDKYDQANLKAGGVYVMTNVPIGVVKITVDATPMNDGLALVQEGKELPKSLPMPVPDALNRKYQAKTTTPLQRTVGPEADQTFDLVIE